MGYASLETILTTLDTLPRRDLELLGHEVARILKELDEQSEAATTPTEQSAAQGYYVSEMVRCGKPSCKKCQNAPDGRGHGPYLYRVRYSPKHKRNRKEYVGRAPEGKQP